MEPESFEDSALYVVGVHFNPAESHTRDRLTHEAIARFKNDFALKGITLVLVECCVGDTDSIHVSKDEPLHLVVSTESAAAGWTKENLINLGVRHLTVQKPDWKYAGYCDLDVTIINPSHKHDVLVALQHHPIVQGFETVVYLGPSGKAIATRQSFASALKEGVLKDVVTAQDTAAGKRKREASMKLGTSGSNVSTGFLWYFTRTFFRATGGMWEHGYIGCGDYVMSMACIGRAEIAVEKGLHANYLASALKFQALALAQTRGVLGCVPGNINHHFHGPIKNRYYGTRGRILRDHHFDPYADLKLNEHGVLVFAGNKPDLEEAFRAYARARNEDDVRTD